MSLASDVDSEKRSTTDTNNAERSHDEPMCNANSTPEAGSVGAGEGGTGTQNNRDIMDSDDESEDELMVSTASLPEVDCLYVGESVHCTIRLNQEIAADQMSQINDYICFNWKRSTDQNEWILASSGTAQSNAMHYVPTADDLGYYIRCEVWFDEQRPVPTCSYLVGLSSTHKEELRLAVAEGVRGFSLNAVICDLEAPDDDPINQQQEEEHDTERQRFQAHIFLQNKFIRIFDVDAQNKILVKAMYSEKCSIKVSSNTGSSGEEATSSAIHTGSNSGSSFYLTLPTCTLKCTFPNIDVTNYFALCFRCFQALATHDICSEVFTLTSNAATTSWRNGSFRFDDHTVTDLMQQREMHDTFLKTLDVYMRQHERTKYGVDWLLARDTLLAVAIGEGNDALSSSTT